MLKSQAPAPQAAAPTGPTDSAGRADLDPARPETQRQTGGLAVQNLTVQFGEVTAVADASVTVAPGEILALLGPSGCGKSTLLRAVAGLERPQRGTVTWDGESVDSVPVHQRGFGLMFQDGQLFPHRNVAGNVAYGLRAAKVPRDQIEQTVAELLDMVGLPGFADRAVVNLSGGERQRVALARALAPRPRLLLLDEPLSALDRDLRDRLAVDLRQVLRGTATTAIYVTHDHDEAFTMADRVAVMSGGRILQIGTPHDVWRAPATKDVARFLGYRWFLPAAGRVMALHPGSFALTPATEVRAGVLAKLALPARVVARVGVHREGDVVRLDAAQLGIVDVQLPANSYPSVGESITLWLRPDGVGEIAGSMR